MIKSNRTAKILTISFLLVSFYLIFFPNLTGLVFHQYFGLWVGILLAAYFLTHAVWIRQVTTRFFTKLPSWVRFYYVVDISLLISIAGILASGVLISGWVAIDYALYPLARTIHILSSIAGLGILTIKYALRWKWFSKMLQPIRVPRVFSGKDHAEPLIVNSKERTAIYIRWNALKTIGVISVVVVFGLYKAMDAITAFNGTAIFPNP